MRLKKDIFKVVVVLPAFNEARAIGGVVESIPASIGSMQVQKVVVDDGSTDATARAARDAGARVVRHLTNCGVGAATRTGFRAAIELGGDVIVTMDADGQHDPANIKSLVDCLIEGNYDVVIGDRMLHPQGMPASRIGANWLLNAITFLVYHGTVSDTQSGFKCFSPKAIRTMDLKADSYAICSEMVGEIFAKGLRYGSVPVQPVYTTYSRAKGQHFLNGINIILHLFARMMRRV